MKGPSVYMESMWRDFPTQILESKVLRFLPIASLCRFRTVSKEWNMIINHPDFVSSHARASSSEDYVLITVQVDRPLNSTGGWEVLDVVNNRFFTLSDDFLTKYIRLQVPHLDWDWRVILAANGGLFCFLYTYGYKREFLMLVVCNPVLKIAKQLPHLPEWSKEYFRVVMSTDRVSMEYEIFVFIYDHVHYQPIAVYIYESKTGKWRATISTMPLLHQPRLYWVCASGFVKLNGFYKIFRRSDHPHRRVVFYDKLTGMASELGFDLPCGDGDKYFNLVVSKDRLFYVTMGGTKVHFIKIFEVILTRKECIQFIEMPSELLKWVVGDHHYDIEGVIQYYGEPFVFTGCANSILMCSYIGRSVAYNLLDKSWHIYCDNNLLQARKQVKHQYYWNLYGSDNCLSLCAP